MPPFIPVSVLSNLSFSFAFLKTETYIKPLQCFLTAKKTGKHCCWPQDAPRNCCVSVGACDLTAGPFNSHHDVLPTARWWSTRAHIPVITQAWHTSSQWPVKEACQHQSTSVRVSRWFQMWKTEMHVGQNIRAANTGTTVTDGQDSGGACVWRVLGPKKRTSV